jgi:hypothetical protein
MKNIFNNRSNSTIYILFTVSILSFAVLLLCQMFFRVDVSPFVLVITLLCTMFFGGILMQIRSGPPW